MGLVDRTGIEPARTSNYSRRVGKDYQSFVALHGFERLGVGHRGGPSDQHAGTSPGPPELRRCPFLALLMQQTPTSPGKRRHKAKV